MTVCGSLHLYSKSAASNHPDSSTVVGDVLVEMAVDEGRKQLRSRVRDEDAASSMQPVRATSPVVVDVAVVERHVAAPTNLQPQGINGSQHGSPHHHRAAG